MRKLTADHADVSGLEFAIVSGSMPLIFLLQCIDDLAPHLAGGAQFVSEASFQSISAQVSGLLPALRGTSSCEVQENSLPCFLAPKNGHVEHSRPRLCWLSISNARLLAAKICDQKSNFLNQHASAKISGKDSYRNASSTSFNQSGRLRTSRGLGPSAAPTMPSCSMRSIR